MQSALFFYNLNVFYLRTLKKYVLVITIVIIVVVVSLSYRDRIRIVHRDKGV